MPGYWVGTAVSVNSFTVNNNLSTAESRGEVNLILGRGSVPETKVSVARWTGRLPLV